MRFFINGAMGDEISVTAAVRETRKRFPNQLIQIIKGNEQIWRHNPYLGWGNAIAGRRIDCYSWEPDHRGTRTQLYCQFAGLDLEPKDCKAELHWTPQELCQELPAAELDRTIAIDPGAGWVTREWGYEKWHFLSSALRADGWDVVHVGATRGRPLEGARYLVKAFNLRQLAVYLSRCRLFIGNDSGLMHLGAAVGLPQVIVYGISRFVAGPYPDTVPVYPSIQCHRSCFIQCCAPRVRTYRNACMETISVDQVYQAAQIALHLKPFGTRPVPTVECALATIETTAEGLSEMAREVALGASLHDDYPGVHLDEDARILATLALRAASEGIPLKLRDTRLPLMRAKTALGRALWGRIRCDVIENEAEHVCPR
jgi:hypothetical protein